MIYRLNRRKVTYDKDMVARVRKKGIISDWHDMGIPYNGTHDCD